MSFCWGQRRSLLLARLHSASLAKNGFDPLTLLGFAGYVAALHGWAQTRLRLACFALLGHWLHDIAQHMLAMPASLWIGNSMLCYACPFRCAGARCPLLRSLRHTSPALLGFALLVLLSLSEPGQGRCAVSALICDAPPCLLCLATLNLATLCMTH